MSVVVAGVDGGGSKTQVWISGIQGLLLGEAEGPGSAVKPGEADRSAQVDREHSARGAVGLWYGCSHATRALYRRRRVGRDDQSHALWQAITNRDVADEVIVRTDAQIALEDASEKGAGILLMGGTGSIAFAAGLPEESARCGGWGPVCGDEGGGAWIGTARAFDRYRGVGWPRTGDSARRLNPRSCRRTPDRAADAWGSAASPRC